MNTKSNILYGGFEGSDKEICQNAESLGEAILNKLRDADRKIILVQLFCFKFNFILIIIQLYFVCYRLMELMAKKSAPGNYSQEQSVWQNIYKKIITSNRVMLFQFAVKTGLNLQ